MAEKQYDSSDPKQVNEARKRAGRRKKASMEVIEALMQHKQGRAWLWDLIEGTDFNGMAIIPGDTHLTYYNLGIQNVGKRLLAEAIQFEKLYFKMAAEAREARTPKDEAAE